MRERDGSGDGDGDGDSLVLDAVSEVECQQFNRTTDPAQEEEEVTMAACRVHAGSGAV
jgi:hypothetical protein